MSLPEKARSFLSAGVRKAPAVFQLVAADQGLEHRKLHRYQRQVLFVFFRRTGCGANHAQKMSAKPGITV